MSAPVIRMDRGESPYPPLIGQPGNLNRYPDASEALRARLAALYGVGEEAVLVTRGAGHALELVLRTRPAALDIPGGAPDWVAALAKAYDVETGAGGVRYRQHPGLTDSAEPVSGEGWTMIDESALEYSALSSFAGQAAGTEGLIVVHGLERAYGLAGVPAGAVIAAPETLAALKARMEPNAIPAPNIAAALDALHPTRMAAQARRLAEAKTERARLAEALDDLDGMQAHEAMDNHVIADISGMKQKAQLTAAGIAVRWLSESRFAATVGTPEENDSLIAALGGQAAATPRRRAEVIRETRETRIVASVDLDRAAPVRIDTGVAFYDHMLEQVAAHGGLSLILSCEGDLPVDAHHAVEDCALAFGEAVAKALGDKKGVGRYGFTTPMDEAQARVAIDLSGRPAAKFEGGFARSEIGGFPTEMTPHVFRSLADSLRAAIHVEVTGEDDHHKVEACFKGFGRALRQAVRIEGGDTPSTKGVL